MARDDDFSTCRRTSTFLKTYQQDRDVGLVTIDPVDAYIGADVDGHKNTAVRAVLEPISEMADRRRVAILAVTHFSKQSGSKALYRFIGSKSQTADQALAAENGTREQATAKGDTAEFLREVLAAGPVAVWEIQDEARSAGMLGPTQPISQSKPFRSARMALGIVPSKRGMSDGWVWELPKMPSGSEDAFQKERAPSKIEGAFGSPSRVLAGDGPRDVCARSTRHDDNYPELPAILDRRGQP